LFFLRDDDELVLCSGEEDDAEHQHYANDDGDTACAGVGSVDVRHGMKYIWYFSGKPLKSICNLTSQPSLILPNMLARVALKKWMLSKHEHFCTVYVLGNIQIM
jgi:hypothetical protein